MVGFIVRLHGEGHSSANWTQLVPRLPFIAAKDSAHFVPVKIPRQVEASPRGDKNRNVLHVVMPTEAAGKPPLAHIGLVSSGGRSAALKRTKSAETGEKQEACRWKRYRRKTL